MASYGRLRYKSINLLFFCRVLMGCIRSKNKDTKITIVSQKSYSDSLKLSSPRPSASLTESDAIADDRLRREISNLDNLLGLG